MMLRMVGRQLLCPDCGGVLEVVWRYCMPWHDCSSAGHRSPLGRHPPLTTTSWAQPHQAAVLFNSDINVLCTIFTINTWPSNWHSYTQHDREMRCMCTKQLSMSVWSVRQICSSAKQARRQNGCLVHTRGLYMRRRHKQVSSPNTVNIDVQCVHRCQN